MKTKITVKNYRCFVAPTTFEIRKGFTAFTGANNAGKSAIMRFFLEFRPLLQMLADNASLARSVVSPQGFGPFLHVLDQEEVFSNLNSLPISVEFCFDREDGDDLTFKTAKFVFEVSHNRNVSLVVSQDGATQPEKRNVGIDNGRFLSMNGRQVIDLVPMSTIAQSLSKSLYIGPFRNTINVGTKTDYLDIKIGQSFIEEFKALKTGVHKKSNAGISKLTDQIRSIFRFTSLDIAPAADGESLHININGRPFKQHELGSGLAQFVVVLANAATKNPDWIFIDEPELNLHPSLQLEFLTALGSYAAEGVIFSTHSLGLARASAERIYTVVRATDGDSRLRPLESVSRLAEFLGEMSFSSQKELGFEKLLLVEGPTEVKALQQFLRTIKKDHRVLLLPIHGHIPKADELEEILRITTDVSALIDSERKAEGAELEIERSQFLVLCQQKKLWRTLWIGEPSKTIFLTKWSRMSSEQLIAG